MNKKMPELSIIIPVFNEEKEISHFFDNLNNSINNDIVQIEIIVVDGGSEDNTIKKIQEYSLNNDITINVFCLPKGKQPNRAVQMNFGASKAKGNIFLFLHIDTILPEKLKPFSLIKKTIEKGKNGGAFNIRFEPKNFRMKIVEILDRFLINATGCFFGDQAIFLSKNFFNEINGYKEVALMEDLIMSDELRRSKKYIIFKEIVTTSSRRFYNNGILRQMFLNIYLFNCFRFGGSPDYIIKKYERNKKN
jgi:rSAM/selenodomain-associated transferase 2